MKKVAVKLLIKYGNDVVVDVKSNGVYNPDTGDIDYTSATTPAKAYIGNYTVAELASDNVNAMDMKIIISPDFAIVKDDVLVNEGKTIRVISVRMVTTQNSLIVQELQARAV